jgi:hypothetical protein
VLSQSRRTSLIQDCLSRVYVLRCSTSLQWLASLSSVRSLLAFDPSIRLLAIDSITSLHWLDQASGSTVPETQRGIVKLLKVLLAELKGLVVLCVKALLFSTSGGGVGEYMDREWTQLVTHRYTFTVQVWLCCLVRSLSPPQGRAIVTSTESLRSHVLMTHHANTTHRPSMLFEIGDEGVSAGRLM